MCFLLLRVIDLRGFSDLRWLCLRLWKWPVWKCWMLQISLKRQGSLWGLMGCVISCSNHHPGIVWTRSLLHVLDLPLVCVSLWFLAETVGKGTDECPLAPAWDSLARSVTERSLWGKFPGVIFTLMLVSTLVYVCEDNQTRTSTSILSCIGHVQVRW